MKVLIVDDWDTRHHRVREVFRSAGRPAVFKSRMHPNAVTDEDILDAEVVFLDHDMCQAEEDHDCPNPRVKPGENFLDAHCGCPTGQDLVKRLVALPARPPCIVHSQNPVGGRAMAQGLLDAGFPVAWSPVTTWTSPAVSLLRLWNVPEPPGEG